MSDKRCVQRLVSEWMEHESLIIAYDYDDTVFDFHNTKDTFDDVIKLLRKCKKLGAKLIVFTCCGEDQYSDIKAFLQSNDIPFDSINDNVDGVNFTGRKIFYNILLDDRAGLKSAYKMLCKAYNEVYKIKNNLKGENI